MVLQPDGKLVAAGTTAVTNGDVTTSDFAVVRYRPNGTLDSTFGRGGRVVTDIDNDSSDSASGIVLQPDGKLVVAGTTKTMEGHLAFALVRYNRNGTLDSGFGNSGKVTMIIGTEAAASALALQADGKLVAVGWALGYSSFGQDVYSFAVARYNSDGSLDGGFGTAGTITTSISYATDVATAVVVQSDGRLVVAGVTHPVGSSQGFALTRYNADGALDATFNSRSGIVTTYFGSDRLDGATAVVEQHDGKLVAAGFGPSGLLGGNFELARYLGAPCLGDCTGDGVVTVAEVITGVDIVLGELPVSACPAFANGSGMVDIAQLVAGVKNALNGCGAA